MFCRKCGKEVQEDWVTCPNCGNPIHQNNTSNISENKTPQNTVTSGKKKEKKKKPIFKRIWFWILVVIVIFVGIKLLGGGDDEKSSSNDTKVQTMDEVGGYQQWADDEYPGKVRTDIVVELPVAERDSNDYCVHILTALGDPIYIRQQDESNVSDWEWLNNAVADEDGGSTATFQATLTFDGGVKVDGKVIPKFVVEDIESYREGSVEGTSGVTVLPVTVQNNTGVDIFGLYASTVDTDNWEEDILGTEVLCDGDSIVINFSYPEDETMWDFAMKDSEDNMIEFYGLDFSKCSSDGATLVLEYDGEQGYATLQ